MDRAYEIDGQSSIYYLRGLLKSMPSEYQAIMSKIYHFFKNKLKSISDEITFSTIWDFLDSWFCNNAWIPILFLIFLGIVFEIILVRICEFFKKKLELWENGSSCSQKNEDVFPKGMIFAIESWSISKTSSAKRAETFSGRITTSPQSEENGDNTRERALSLDEYEYQGSHFCESHSSSGGTSTSLSVFHSEVKKIFIRSFHRKDPQSECQTIQYSSNNLFSIMKTNRKKNKFPDALSFQSTFKFARDKDLNVTPCPPVHLFLSSDQIRHVEENVRRKIPVNPKAMSGREADCLHPSYQEPLIHYQHSNEVVIPAQAQDTFQDQNAIQNQIIHEAQFTSQTQPFIHNQELVSSQPGFVWPLDFMRLPFSNSLQDSFQAQQVDHKDKSQHFIHIPCIVETEDSTKGIVSDEHFSETQCSVYFNDQNKSNHLVKGQNSIFQNAELLSLNSNSFAEAMPQQKVTPGQEPMASLESNQYYAYSSMFLSPTIKKQRNKRKILDNERKLSLKVPFPKAKKISCSQVFPIIVYHTSKNKTELRCKKKKIVHQRKIMSDIALYLISVSKLINLHVKKYLLKNLVVVIPDLIKCEHFLQGQNKSLDTEKINYASSTDRVSSGIIENIEHLFIVNTHEIAAPCSLFETNRESKESSEDSVQQTFDLNIPKHEGLPEVSSESVSFLHIESNKGMKVQKDIQSTENVEELTVSTPNIQRCFSKDSVQDAKNSVEIILNFLGINLLISVGPQKHVKNELKDINVQVVTGSINLKEEKPLTANITEYDNPSGSEKVECDTRSNEKNRHQDERMSDTSHNTKQATISELFDMELCNKLKANAGTPTINCSHTALKQEKLLDEKKIQEVKHTDKSPILRKPREWDSEEEEKSRETVRPLAEDFRVSICLKQKDKCDQFEMAQMRSGNRKNQSKEKEVQSKTISTQTVWETSPCPLTNPLQVEEVKQRMNKSRDREEAAGPMHPTLMPENSPTGEYLIETTECRVPFCGNSIKTLDGHIIEDKEDLKKDLRAVATGPFKVRKKSSEPKNVVGVKPKIVKVKKPAFFLRLSITARDILNHRREVRNSFESITKQMLHDVILVRGLLNVHPQRSIIHNNKTNIKTTPQKTQVGKKEENLDSLNKESEAIDTPEVHLCHGVKVVEQVLPETVAHIKKSFRCDAHPAKEIKMEKEMFQAISFPEAIRESVDSQRMDSFCVANTKNSTSTQTELQYCAKLELGPPTSGKLRIGDSLSQSRESNVPNSGNDTREISCGFTQKAFSWSLNYCMPLLIHSKKKKDRTRFTNTSTMRLKYTNKVKPPASKTFNITGNKKKSKLDLKTKLKRINQTKAFLPECQNTLCLSIHRRLQGVFCHALLKQRGRANKICVDCILESSTFYKREKKLREEKQNPFVQAAPQHGQHQWANADQRKDTLPDEPDPSSPISISEEQLVNSQSMKCQKDSLPSVLEANLQMAPIQAEGLQKTTKTENGINFPMVPKILSPKTGNSSHSEFTNMTDNDLESDKNSEHELDLYPAEKDSETSTSLQVTFLQSSDPVTRSFVSRPKGKRKVLRSKKQIRVSQRCRTMSEIKPSVSQTVNFRYSKKLEHNKEMKNLQQTGSIADACLDIIHYKVYILLNKKIKNLKLWTDKQRIRRLGRMQRMQKKSPNGRNAHCPVSVDLSSSSSMKNCEEEGEEEPECFLISENSPSLIFDMYQEKDHGLVRSDKQLNQLGRTITQIQPQTPTEVISCSTLCPISDELQLEKLEGYFSISSLKFGEAKNNALSERESDLSHERQHKEQAADSEKEAKELSASYTNPNHSREIKCDSNKMKDMYQEKKFTDETSSLTNVALDINMSSKIETEKGTPSIKTPCSIQRKLERLLHEGRVTSDDIKEIDLQNKEEKENDDDTLLKSFPQYSQHFVFCSHQSRDPNSHKLRKQRGRNILFIVEQDIPQQSQSADLTRRECAMCTSSSKIPPIQSEELQIDEVKTDRTKYDIPANGTHAQKLNSWNRLEREGLRNDLQATITESLNLSTPDVLRSKRKSKVSTYKALQGKMCSTGITMKSRKTSVSKLLTIPQCGHRNNLLPKTLKSQIYELLIHSSVLPDSLNTIILKDPTAGGKKRLLTQELAATMLESLGFSTPTSKERENLKLMHKGNEMSNNSLTVKTRKAAISQTLITSECGTPKQDKPMAGSSLNAIFSPMPLSLDLNTCDGIKDRDTIWTMRFSHELHDQSVYEERAWCTHYMDKDTTSNRTENVKDQGGEEGSLTSQHFSLSAQKMRGPNSVQSGLQLINSATYPELERALYDGQAQPVNVNNLQSSMVSIMSPFLNTEESEIGFIPCDNTWDENPRRKCDYPISEQKAWTQKDLTSLEPLQKASLVSSESKCESCTLQFAGKRDKSPKARQASRLLNIARHYTRVHRKKKHHNSKYQLRKVECVEELLFYAIEDAKSCPLKFITDELSLDTSARAVFSNRIPQRSMAEEKAELQANLATTSLRPYNFFMPVLSDFKSQVNTVKLSENEIMLNKRFSTMKKKKPSISKIIRINGYFITNHKKKFKLRVKMKAIWVSENITDVLQNTTHFILTNSNRKDSFKKEVGLGISNFTHTQLTYGKSPVEGIAEYDDSVDKSGSNFLMEAKLHVGQCLGEKQELLIGSGPFYTKNLALNPHLIKKSSLEKSERILLREYLPQRSQIYEANPEINVKIENNSMHISLKDALPNMDKSQNCSDISEPTSNTTKHGVKKNGKSFLKEKSSFYLTGIVTSIARHLVTSKEFKKQIGNMRVPDLSAHEGIRSQVESTDLQSPHDGDHAAVNINESQDFRTLEIKVENGEVNTGTKFIYMCMPIQHIKMELPYSIWDMYEKSAKRNCLDKPKLKRKEECGQLPSGADQKRQPDPLTSEVLSTNTVHCKDTVLQKRAIYLIDQEGNVKVGEEFGQEVILSSNSHTLQIERQNNEFKTSWKTKSKSSRVGLEPIACPARESFHLENTKVAKEVGMYHNIKNISHLFGLRKTDTELGSKVQACLCTDLEDRHKMGTAQRSHAKSGHRPRIILNSVPCHKRAPLHLKPSLSTTRKDCDDSAIDAKMNLKGKEKGESADSPLKLNRQKVHLSKNLRTKQLTIFTQNKEKLLEFLLSYMLYLQAENTQKQISAKSSLNSKIFNPAVEKASSEVKIPDQSPSSEKVNLHTKGRVNHQESACEAVPMSNTHSLIDIHRITTPQVKKALKALDNLDYHTLNTEKREQNNRIKEQNQYHLSFSLENLEEHISCSQNYSHVQPYLESHTKEALSKVGNVSSRTKGLDLSSKDQLSTVCECRPEWIFPSVILEQTKEQDTVLPLESGSKTIKCPRLLSSERKQLSGVQISKSVSNDSSSTPRLDKKELSDRASEKKQEVCLPKLLLHCVSQCMQLCEHEKQKGNVEYGVMKDVICPEREAQNLKKLVLPHISYTEYTPSNKAELQCYKKEKMICIKHEKDKPDSVVIKACEPIPLPHFKLDKEKIDVLLSSNVRQEKHKSQEEKNGIKGMEMKGIIDSNITLKTEKLSLSYPSSRKKLTLLFDTTEQQGKVQEGLSKSDMKLTKSFISLPPLLHPNLNSRIKVRKGKSRLLKSCLPPLKPLLSLKGRKMPFSKTFSRDNSCKLIKYLSQKKEYRTNILDLKDIIGLICIAQKRKKPPFKCLLHGKEQWWNNKIQKIIQGNKNNLDVVQNKPWGSVTPSPYLKRDPKIMEAYLQGIIKFYLGSPALSELSSTIRMCQEPTDDISSSTEKAKHLSLKHRLQIASKKVIHSKRLTLRQKLFSSSQELQFNVEEKAKKMQEDKQIKNWNKLSTFSLPYSEVVTRINGEEAMQIRTRFSTHHPKLQRPSDRGEIIYTKSNFEPVLNSVKHPVKYAFQKEEESTKTKRTMHLKEKPSVSQTIQLVITEPGQELQKIKDELNVVETSTSTWMLSPCLKSDTRREKADGITEVTLHTLPELLLQKSSATLSEVSKEWTKGHSTSDTQKGENHMPQKTEHEVKIFGEKVTMHTKDKDCKGNKILSQDLLSSPKEQGKIDPQNEEHKRVDGKAKKQQNCNNDDKDQKKMDLNYTKPEKCSQDDKEQKKMDPEGKEQGEAGRGGHQQEEECPEDGKQETWNHKCDTQGKVNLNSIEARKADQEGKSKEKVAPEYLPSKSSHKLDIRTEGEEYMQGTIKSANSQLQHQKLLETGKTEHTESTEDAGKSNVKIGKQSQIWIDRGKNVHMKDVMHPKDTSSNKNQLTLSHVPSITGHYGPNTTDEQTNINENLGHVQERKCELDEGLTLASLPHSKLDIEIKVKEETWIETGSFSLQSQSMESSDAEKINYTSSSLNDIISDSKRSRYMSYKEEENGVNTFERSMMHPKTKHEYINKLPLSYVPKGKRLKVNFEKQSKKKQESRKEKIMLPRETHSIITSSDASKLYKAEEVETDVMQSYVPYSMAKESLPFRQIASTKAIASHAKKRKLHLLWEEEEEQTSAIDVLTQPNGPIFKAKKTAPSCVSSVNEHGTLSKKKTPGWNSNKKTGQKQERARHLDVVVTKSDASASFPAGQIASAKQISKCAKKRKQYQAQEEIKTSATDGSTHSSGLDLKAKIFAPPHVLNVNENIISRKRKTPWRSSKEKIVQKQEKNRESNVFATKNDTSMPSVPHHGLSPLQSEFLMTSCTGELIHAGSNEGITLPNVIIKANQQELYDEAKVSIRDKDTKDRITLRIRISPSTHLNNRMPPFNIKEQRKEAEQGKSELMMMVLKKTASLPSPSFLKSGTRGSEEEHVLGETQISFPPPKIQDVSDSKKRACMESSSYMLNNRKEPTQEEEKNRLRKDMKDKKIPKSTDQKGKKLSQSHTLSIKEFQRKIQEEKLINTIVEFSISQLQLKKFSGTQIADREEVYNEIKLLKEHVPQKEKHVGINSIMHAKDIYLKTKKSPTLPMQNLSDLQWKTREQGGKVEEDGSKPGVTLTKKLTKTSTAMSHQPILTMNTGTKEECTPMLTRSSVSMGYFQKSSDSEGGIYIQQITRDTSISLQNEKQHMSEGKEEAGMQIAKILTTHNYQETKVQELKDEQDLVLTKSSPLLLDLLHPKSYEKIEFNDTKLRLRNSALQRLPTKGETVPREAIVGDTMKDVKKEHIPWREETYRKEIIDRRSTDITLKSRKSFLSQKLHRTELQMHINASKSKEQNNKSQPRVLRKKHTSKPSPTITLCKGVQVDEERLESKLSSPLRQMLLALSDTEKMADKEAMCSHVRKGKQYTKQIEKTVDLTTGVHCKRTKVSPILHLLNAKEFVLNMKVLEKKLHKDKSELAVVATRSFLSMPSPPSRYSRDKTQKGTARVTGHSYPQGNFQEPADAQETATRESAEATEHNMLQKQARPQKSMTSAHQIGEHPQVESECESAPLNHKIDLTRLGTIKREKMLDMSFKGQKGQPEKCEKESSTKIGNWKKENEIKDNLRHKTSHKFPVSPPKKSLREALITNSTLLAKGSVTVRAQETGSGKSDKPKKDRQSNATISKMLTPEKTSLEKPRITHLSKSQNKGEQNVNMKEQTMPQFKSGHQIKLKSFPLLNVPVHSKSLRVPLQTDVDKKTAVTISLQIQSGIHMSTAEFNDTRRKEDPPSIVLEHEQWDLAFPQKSHDSLLKSEHLEGRDEMNTISDVNQKKLEMDSNCTVSQKEGKLKTDRSRGLDLEEVNREMQKSCSVNLENKARENTSSTTSHALPLGTEESEIKTWIVTSRENNYPSQEKLKKELELFTAKQNLQGLKLLQTNILDSLYAYTPICPKSQKSRFAVTNLKRELKPKYLTMRIPKHPISKILGIIGCGSPSRKRKLEYAFNKPKTMVPSSKDVSGIIIRSLCVSMVSPPHTEGTVASKTNQRREKRVCHSKFQEKLPDARDIKDILTIVKKLNFTIPVLQDSRRFVVNDQEIWKPPDVEPKVNLECEMKKNLCLQTREEVVAGSEDLNITYKPDMNTTKQEEIRKDTITSQECPFEDIKNTIETHLGRTLSINVPTPGLHLLPGTPLFDKMRECPLLSKQGEDAPGTVPTTLQDKNNENKTLVEHLFPIYEALKSIFEASLENKIQNQVLSDKLGEVGAYNPDDAKASSLPDSPDTSSNIYTILLRRSLLKQLTPKLKNKPSMHLVPKATEIKLNQIPEMVNISLQKCKSRPQRAISEDYKCRLYLKHKKMNFKSAKAGTIKSTLKNNYRRGFPPFRCVKAATMNVSSSSKVMTEAKGIKKRENLTSLETWSNLPLSHILHKFSEKEKDDLLVHFCTKTLEIQTIGLPRTVVQSYAMANAQDKSKSLFKCIHSTTKGPKRTNRVLVLFDKKSVCEVDRYLQCKYLHSIPRPSVPVVSKPNVLPKHTSKLSMGSGSERKTAKNSKESSTLSFDKELLQHVHFQKKNPQESSLLTRKFQEPTNVPDFYLGLQGTEQNNMIVLSDLKLQLTPKKDKQCHIWDQGSNSYKHSVSGTQQNTIDFSNSHSSLISDDWTNDVPLNTETSTDLAECPANEESDSKESVFIETNFYLTQKSQEFLFEVPKGIPLADVHKVDEATFLKPFYCEDPNDHHTRTRRKHTSPVAQPCYQSQNSRKHRSNSKMQSPNWLSHNSSNTVETESTSSSITFSTEKHCTTTTWNRTSYSLTSTIKSNTKLNLAKKHGKSHIYPQVKERRKTKYDLQRKSNVDQSSNYSHPQNEEKHVRKKRLYHYESKEPNPQTNQMPESNAHWQNIKFYSKRRENQPFFYACIPADSMDVIPQTIRWVIPPKILQKRNFQVPRVANISESWNLCSSSKKLLGSLARAFNTVSYG